MSYFFKRLLKRYTNEVCASRRLKVRRLSFGEGGERYTGRKFPLFLYLARKSCQTPVSTASPDGRPSELRTASISCLPAEGWPAHPPHPARWVLSSSPNESSPASSPQVVSCGPAVVFRGSASDSYFRGCWMLTVRSLCLLLIGLEQNCVQSAAEGARGMAGQPSFRLQAQDQRQSAEVASRISSTAVSMSSFLLYRVICLIF